ncbi:TIGR03943 family putative permease subunit, partial [Salisediminibacterium halotolerans]
KEDDDWFTASGVLDTTELNGETVPVLKDADIERASEPDSPYVYPSY